MNTKVLFTALMLGISMSAACMTANDFVNPYYPKHIYGGAKLDSVVESTWKGSDHTYFDEKGRMAAVNSYELDEQTQQYKLVGIYTYGYGEGIMFTSTHVRYWEAEESQWIAYIYQFNDIVYDASGNPLSWTMYGRGTNSGTWDVIDFNEVQYDLYENVVLERDSSIEGDETDVRISTYTYVYDYEGRILTQIYNNKNSKIEYTYNVNGDILTETEYYLATSQSYDWMTGEMVSDSVWQLSSYRHYSYNAFNNLEQVIDYNSDSTVRSQISYHYSFPSSTTEVDDAEVAATPGENYSVLLQWPAVAGADSYTLEIRKNGVLICTLIFNSQGQLIGIRLAPALDGARKTQTATQTTNGWQYKLEGLEADTEYSYTAIAKKNEMVLSAQTVFFTTSLQAIEDIHTDAEKLVKVFHNGQYLILRGEKVYTITGQELK